MGGDYRGIPAGSHITKNDHSYMRADLFAEFGLEAQWDKGDRITLVRTKKNPFTIRTVKQNTEDNTIKITIQYPQIDGLEDKAVQDRINTLFEKEAIEAREEGLKNADEMRALRQSGSVSSPNRCETYFDYSVKYNQNRLLSLVFSDYQYTGGAHGSTLQSSHTIDLKTGREYRLKDLMQDQADYISPINSRVREQIDQRIRAGELVEIAAFKTIKGDQDFYLSSSGLVIYFQQYEYFPYSAGIQGFPIDFWTLNDLLKPDFSFLYNTSNITKAP